MTKIYMKNKNNTSTESFREVSLSTHVESSAQEPNPLSRIIARGHSNKNVSRFFIT